MQNLASGACSSFPLAQRAVDLPQPSGNGAADGDFADPHSGAAPKFFIASHGATLGLRTASAGSLSSLSPCPETFGSMLPQVGTVAPGTTVLAPGASAVDNLATSSSCMPKSVVAEDRAVWQDISSVATAATTEDPLREAVQ